MKVCNVEEMRRLDKRASDEFGIKEEILMENAGQASYFAILSELKDIRKRFAVFCGIGNNGGDGFVVARKIHSNGSDVRIFIIGDPEKFKGAARMNLEIIKRLPISVKKVSSVDDIKDEIKGCDVIIDAIFGTGLSREVEGIYRDVIRAINESGKYVVSIDIPSGVSGDTGKVMGIAVKANLTITFGLPKIGNILYPGYELCGKLYVTHISFPPSLYEDESIMCEINEPIPIPERIKTGHKGTFGEVLFIAGARNYFGAPFLSSYSFLKAGGGYSRLACPQSVAPYIATLGPEIVFHPQAETKEGTLSLENKERLLQLSERVDMVVIGPGLSLNEETQRLVMELVEKIEKPILIDGDGLTAISKDLSVVKNRKAETVLTPHPGEMSRITKKTVSEIDLKKIEILKDTCKELKAIIVLKGAHSLIGTPSGRIFINMTGNPGMATAGSGDVLTGTISALFGQGMSFQDSVRMGVFIHGFSGDIAASEKGEDGITAKDISDFLPETMKRCRKKEYPKYYWII